MALPLEFRDTCRACMKRRGDTKMFFFAQINSVSISVMLTKIALLPIESSDNLPKVLCSICIRKLNEAYNFQQMCIKSHIAFNDMLFTREFSQLRGERKEQCDIVKTEPCDSFESEKCAIEDFKPLQKPKIEPGLQDVFQEGSNFLKRTDYFKSGKKSKIFTCNHCHDVFETWDALTIHIEEHAVTNNSKSNKGEDSSNYDDPGNGRKLSEVSIANNTLTTEVSIRQNVFDFDEQNENNNSIDGLPLEPICSVHVKDEIVSDQSSCAPDEETYVSVNKIQLDTIKDDEPHKVQNEPCNSNTNNKIKNGLNFTNSKSPVCEMCGFKPKIPALMHAHVRNRHPDNYMEYVENLKASGECVIKCRICDVYLFSSTIYGQHLKYTHSQIVNDCSGYFECNHCDQTFNSKNEFFLHKNQAHNMRRINKAKQLFICLLCDKQFGRYVHLQQHEETHENNGTSTMAIGNALSEQTRMSKVSSLSRRSSELIPMSGYLRKKKVEPPLSQLPSEELNEISSFLSRTKTSSRKNVNSNITTSAGGAFQCKGCDKSFATEFGLRVHIGCVHKGMEKLPPKKSNSGVSVSNQQVKKQSSPELPPSAPSILNENSYCEICDKFFESVTEYGLHMQKHSEFAYTRRDSEDATRLTQSKTPTKGSVKNDLIKLYQKGKNIKYKCKICSIFFPDKTLLLKHAFVVHKKIEGRKHFNCNICFRTITGLQNFNSHMNSHKNELSKGSSKNSHACHLCAGNFVEREDLQKHLVVAHSFNPMIFYKK